MKFILEEEDLNLLIDVILNLQMKRNFVELRESGGENGKYVLEMTRIETDELIELLGHKYASFSLSEDASEQDKGPKLERLLGIFNIDSSDLF